MRRLGCDLFWLFLGSMVWMASHGAVDGAENWPGWRGPRGDGTSAESGAPVHWNGPKGENIAWKTPIPGVGHSSPIVWGDRIFVASCLPDEQDRVLICLDRRTGKPLWQRSVVRSPLEKKHSLNSFASGTPCTDGERVYVTFLETDFGSATEPTPGNMVVAAYDFDGRQLWSAKCAEAYCAPIDVLVNQGIVWVGQSRARHGPRDPGGGGRQRLG